MSTFGAPLRWGDRLHSIGFVRPALVMGALSYLLGLYWAMSHLAWDTWGAIVYAPLLIMATIFLARRMFSGSLQPLVKVMVIGFAVKILGSLARYVIAYVAYGGASDSARYHSAGAMTAHFFWSGQIDLWAIIPSGTNTVFVEGVAGLVYTIIGTSQLAGFMVFAWLGYVGVMCYVKAACVAVPGLAQRRYAWLCVLMPSIVYWPSSLGKESLMMLGLGFGSLGVARLFERGGFLRGLLYAGAGFGLAGFIRPHMAGVFLAGVLPGLIVAFRRPASSGNEPKRNRFVLFLTISVASVAVVYVASMALTFLEPSKLDGEEPSGGVGGLTAILDETTRRSEIGGSSFSPPSITNPLTWPYAVVRTLTRPLPFEARGLFPLISAAEMTVLLGMCAVWWRPLRGLRRSAARVPFITYAVVTLFMGGLVYTSFANLGILTRQKSLLLPMMLLLPCLPLPPERPQRLGRTMATERTEPIGVGVS